jgi:SAM-dependent methyltransferase
MAEIKKNVEKVLVCPTCKGALVLVTPASGLICQDCGYEAGMIDGKLAFTPIPETIQETEFRERGEEKGTPWRQANWNFLEAQIDRLPADALVLDVGSGRGDFSQLTQRRDSFALDIYPYPEVDIVCDLTQVNPFQENSFDAIVLMNVLEHVFDTGTFLKELVKVLKPGGKLFVAVPFLIKVHQAPFDFIRFTQFSLQCWGDESGLAVELLEGYYDPMFLLEQGIRNLKRVIRFLPKRQNRLARVPFFLVRRFAAWVGAVVGKGYTRIPSEDKSPAPIGYHVVYRKETGEFS